MPVHYGGNMPAGRSPSLDAVLAKLKKLPREMRKQAPMFRKIAVICDQWAMRNFQQEGKLAESGGWAPLAESTIRQRTKGRGKGRGRRVRILQDTGVGRASVRTASNAQMAKIYSQLDYMVMHQLGGAKLPQRKFIPEREQVIQPVMAAANAHLHEAVKRCGL